MFARPIAFFSAILLSAVVGCGAESAEEDASDSEGAASAGTVRDDAVAAANAKLTKAVGEMNAAAASKFEKVGESGTVGDYFYDETLIGHPYPVKAGEFAHARDYDAGATLRAITTTEGKFYLIQFLTRVTRLEPNPRLVTTLYEATGGTWQNAWRESKPARFAVCNVVDKRLTGCKLADKDWPIEATY